MNRLFLLLLWVAFLVTGCGGNKVSREEGFKEDSPFMRNFTLPAPKACEGAKMAMLGQGYRIGASDAKSATGQKDFQLNEESFVTIELRVVCMDRPPESIVFASALKTRYELKKSRQTTDLGLPVLGQLSVPFGSVPESLVKVGTETISDKDYYSSFFDQVESYAE